MFAYVPVLAQHELKKVLVEGKGIPLVMLAGGTADMAVFAIHSKELSRRYKVIRMEHFNVQYATEGLMLSKNYSVSAESKAIKYTLDSLLFTQQGSCKKFREGYKDEKGKFHTPVTTINAMGEEMLLPGKMYRETALKRRCLIISSGFYEWLHIFPVGKKGQLLKTSVKYPYHIHVKNAEYFFMAGIW